jgi:hypothetical protein
MSGFVAALPVVPEALGFVVPEGVAVWFWSYVGLEVVEPGLVPTVLWSVVLPVVPLAVPA